MNLKFKSNIVELTPPYFKENEVVFNSLSTDANFEINNLIEKTINVKYAEVNSFSIEDLFGSLNIIDLTTIAFVHITAYTNPAGLGLTDAQESVPFGLTIDNQTFLKTAQFILTNTLENSLYLSIDGLFPKIEDKDVLLKISIGIK